jgi:hypothetical protein
MYASHALDAFMQFEAATAKAAAAPAAASGAPA